MRSERDHAILYVLLIYQFCAVGNLQICTALQRVYRVLSQIKLKKARQSGDKKQIYTMLIAIK
jgi:hypothetical protein